MWATLSLINKNFWRGYMGPIFTYLVPFVLLLFLGKIIGPQYIVPSIFLISTLCVLLVFMPQSVFEFKNSTILKRIGSTPIKPITFLFAIATFNFILVISSTILMFALSFAVFSDSLNNVNNIIPDSGLLPGAPAGGISIPDYLYMFLHADWGSFIYSFFVMVIMGIFIGLFIVSISRSTLFIQSVGISLILIVFFVGPIALPVSMIAQINVVKYAGYIIPFKYPISLAIESFTSSIGNTSCNVLGSSIWDIDTNYMVYILTNKAEFISVFDRTDKILNLIMPWIFIGIFGYMTSVTFSWSNRGSLTFRWNAPWLTFKSIFIKKEIKLFLQKTEIASQMIVLISWKLKALTRNLKLNIWPKSLKSFMMLFMQMTM